MQRRKEFYAARSITSGDERDEFGANRTIYSHEDYIPLSIEYLPEVISYAPLKNVNHATRSKTEIIETPSSDAKYRQKRYLHCKAGVRIWHIKKLLRQKYELKYHHDVEVFFKHDQLLDEYSIVDLAYIYSWRRVSAATCLHALFYNSVPRTDQFHCTTKYRTCGKL